MYTLFKDQDYRKGRFIFSCSHIKFLCKVQHLVIWAQIWSTRCYPRLDLSKELDCKLSSWAACGGPSVIISRSCSDPGPHDVLLTTPPMGRHKDQLRNGLSESPRAAQTKWSEWMNFLSAGELDKASLRSGCYFKMDKKSRPELELNHPPWPGPETQAPPRIKWGDTGQAAQIWIKLDIEYLLQPSSRSV